MSRSLSLEELLCLWALFQFFTPRVDTGYLRGILMAGFVSITFCLHHWILVCRDVKASLLQFYSPTSVPASVRLNMSV